MVYMISNTKHKQTNMFTFHCVETVHLLGLLLPQLTPGGHRLVLDTRLVLETQLLLEKFHSTIELHCIFIGLPWLRFTLPECI